MTVQPLLNESAVESFAAEMLSHLTGASVTLMTSVGHRTGLFDTLTGLPPSTSEEIAAAARLNERYVREWLSAMVTAGVVRYDAENETFRLPAEHAAILTRAAGADNIATFAGMLSGIAIVEEELIECFRKGGGVPYSAFPRFHELMAEVGDPSRARAITELPAMAPGIVEKLQRGIDVLDIGCGRGFASLELARRYPRSRFVGYDFSPEAIGYGNARAADLGLLNVSFEVRDIAKLDEQARYDWITSFDAIHDQADPEAVVRNIFRALKPGGDYLMMEPAASSHLHRNIGEPMATLFYTISCFHCMTVSLSQGGKGLGTVWGKEAALELLDDTGFTDVRVETVPGDLESAYFFAKKTR